MADSTQAASPAEHASADQNYGKAVPVVRSFLESVLGLLGVEVEVDIDIGEDGLHCDLNTSEEGGGLLVGRHGATARGTESFVPPSRRMKRAAGRLTNSGSP